MPKESFQNPKIHIEELEPELIKEAKELYNEKLPYHNFEHAQKNLKYAKEIIKRCLKAGIGVDQIVVLDALLFHDAGFDKKPEETGCDTQEKYAEYLASVILEKFGRSKEHIEKVQKSIIATTRNATFESIEEKIVRAADLARMPGTYEEFRTDNLNLKKEAEMLSGKEIKMEEWKKNTKLIIDFYLSQDIRLISAHDDESGKSVFHTKVRENLIKFLEDNSLK